MATDAKTEKKLPEVKKGQVVKFTYLKDFGSNKEGDVVKMEGTTAKAILDSHSDLGKYELSVVGTKKGADDKPENVYEINMTIDVKNPGAQAGLKR